MNSIPKKKGWRNGEVVDLAPDEIDYVLDDNSSLLGTNINLVPMQNAVASQRLFYSGRFFSQSDPLEDPDEPWVQNAAPDGESFDAKLGTKAGAIRTDIGGVVKRIKDGVVHMRGDNNEDVTFPLYQNFSMNRKNRFHQTPLVKEGDRVEAGGLIAKSNFTNDKGSLALGRNAHVGVVPYLGYSMDDATVISDSFANRLKSDHMLEFGAEFDPDLKRDKSHFISVFPDRFSKEQIKKVDDHGIVRIGETVEEGDPLILETAPPMVRSEDRLKGSLGRYLRNMRRDQSQVWEHSEPGVVTDVHPRRDGGHSITVGTVKAAKEGDKLVARSGAKFTISKILPDEKMPYTEAGDRFDILANPLGVPSRVNNNFLYEILLGKVAAKRGEPFVMQPFNNADESWSQQVRKILEENGVPDTERVYDPVAEQFLENPITTGNMHILKLQHQGAGKLSARGQGGYSNWEQPRKGGDAMAQAKRLSGLEMTGLMSAGAYGYIKDGMTVRGQKNDDYWRAIRSGDIPQKPGHPFAWDRTKALLHGSGYMVRDKGAGVQRLGPLTDKDIDKWGAKELDNAELVDLKTGKGVTGGLFDESRAFSGNWGKISLDYPLPNPAFEAPLLKLLGFKKKHLEDVIAGRAPISDEIKDTGPQAVYRMLKSIDKEKLRKDMLDTVKGGVKTKRPRAIDILNTLEGLDRNNLEPKDLMITQVPVIPSKYRPFSLAGDTFLPGDVNELYQDVFRLRNQDRELRDTFGEEGAPEHKLSMYNGMRALYGTAPTQNRKLKEKKVSGFLENLLGKSPKYSVFQRNLFSKPVDSSARGVAGLDPTLGLDEVGIPESTAWKLYAPYVQRRLVRTGMSPAQALKEVADTTGKARKALDEELRHRPGVVNRAPAWHKFNSTGAYFKIHDGKNIRVNPLITTGHNLDFDGDTLGIFIPSLPEAVEDVKNKLMPSKQIFSIRNNDNVVNVPTQDLLLGIWNAANSPSKNTHRFLTRADALRAIKQGKISLSDQIEIV